jgi:DNA-directed RNA polymerase specialized sigma24 family protein
MVLSDAALLRGVCRRDHKAMMVLFDRYSAAVYSVALQDLEPEEAEAVLQATFVFLWNRPSVYSHCRYSLQAWLMAEARIRSLRLLKGIAQQ